MRQTMKAKFFLKVLLLLIPLISLASCSSTKKITVYGTPGTELYGPTNWTKDDSNTNTVMTSSGFYSKVGAIGPSGKTKVALNGDAYIAFLLAKEPNSDMVVPFGLNYSNKNGISNACLLTMVLSTAALGVSFAMPESSLSLPLLITGVLGTGVWPWWVALEITQPEDRLKYLKDQRIIPQQFTKPIFNTPQKTLSNNLAQEIRSPRNEIGEKSAKTIGEKSKRSLNKLSSKVEGHYMCSGNLADSSGDIAEKYSTASIILESISPDEVLVDVLDDNGESFFLSKNEYKVVKDKANNYILTHSRFKEAVIKINKNGNLTYIHPDVNIDGDIYKLRLTGTKKK